MREMFRGAFVIARRDFSATVLSKSFLLFLLAPLFPVVVGLIFGGLTVRAAADRAETRVVAVVAGTEQFAALAAARERIDSAFELVRLVELRRVEPEPDSDALRQRLLADTRAPVIAVLDGGLQSPRLSSGLPPGNGVVQQLQLMIDTARARPTGSPTRPITLSVSQCPVGAMTTAHRPIIAQSSQAVLFVLTILLTTMLLSQLIEEKSNKIIEVLAAAVPVGSIFLGKLVGMLSASLLGIAVWTTAGATAFTLFTGQSLAGLPPPAVGWPLFLLLGLVYFAMSYLLLGAIFLGVGGHASSAREVQTLSMPVTMAQIVVFAIAAIAVSEPDSGRAIATAIFPLSSPYVMLARAAVLPELWPHLVAIAWQLLWVGLIVRFAARLFRRSVLSSGPRRRRRWLFGRASA